MVGRQYVSRYTRRRFLPASGAMDLTRERWLRYSVSATLSSITEMLCTIGPVKMEVCTYALNTAYPSVAVSNSSMRSCADANHSRRSSSTSRNGT